MKNETINTLDKITWFLVGFLAAFFSLIIFIKIFANFWALVTGLIVNFVAIYFIRKKAKNKKVVTLSTGAFTSTVFIVAALLLAFIFAPLIWSQISG
ncbi:hypothetical protein GF340_05240 [Candidatus Peregrinibacteria bacterium]|nr:hypothetical protein [Candidatus Peregrinibacteria bacterium]